MPHDITLRPVTQDDEAFLLDLRKQTMTEHLRRAGAADDEEAHMQRVRYHYDDARIICLDSQPIGLFKAYRSETEWYLVQIQVAPGHQGRGIGEQVIRTLLDEARQANLPVSLRVLHGNPARRLYERLGFRPAAEEEIETLLTWRP